MMLPEEVDVLIVGYGPVGAAIAALLGRCGVRMLVVNKLPDVFMAPRAIALDNEALRILQMVGLAHDAFAKVVISHVRINSSGSIDGHAKLVTFYQPELERALRAHAESHSSVIACTGVEMVSFNDDRDGVRRAANERRVGIGRARSKVRTAIGEDGETYCGSGSGDGGGGSGGSTVTSDRHQGERRQGR